MIHNLGSTKDTRSRILVSAWSVVTGSHSQHPVPVSVLSDSLQPSEGTMHSGKERAGGFGFMVNAHMMSGQQGHQAIHGQGNDLASNSCQLLPGSALRLLGFCLAVLLWLHFRKEPTSCKCMPPVHMIWAS